MALERDFTPAEAAGPLRAEIERYTRRHVHAVGADGREWAVDVGGGHIERIDTVDHIVMSLTLTPPDGKVTDFDLRYDVIVDQLVTHKAIATIRTQWDKGTTAARAGDARSLRLAARSRLRVDATAARGCEGFLATVGLGVQHIGEGADHLLFLLMLLIPAPLVARRGRWSRATTRARTVIRVVHVVTAFAVGHSITLALATFGLIQVPRRLVESMIALSILVSAVHALRPLVPRRRGDDRRRLRARPRPRVRDAARRPRALGRRARVLAARRSTSASRSTQLLVVALMMPSLYALSRSAAYGAVRVALALARHRARRRAGCSSARR